MSEGTEMPAILGVTTGMTRDNCMAYCYNKKKGYSYFGERFLHHREAMPLPEGPPE